MHIPVDEARKDDAIYSYRDVLKELKFCAYDVPHRNETTNEVLRFFAWLFRSALKMIEEKNEEIDRLKAEMPVHCNVCNFMKHGADPDCIVCGNPKSRCYEYEVRGNDYCAEGKEG